MSDPSSPAHFPTTRWTLVRRAGDPADPEARQALEGLCRDYWYPLYAYVRRLGLSADDACDLVQGFLADLIDRGDLANVAPERGRFRSFLRASCDHFLSHQRRRNRALKRGGGRFFAPIDGLDAENRYCLEPHHTSSPDRLFERRWALQLLQNVLAHLESTMHEEGKATLFARLKPMLEGDGRLRSRAQIAADLGMTEAAVTTASRRLRNRYRGLLRAEVSRTVAVAADVDSELAELLNALAD